MTNKEREKIVDQARSEMARKVHDEYKGRNLPHPANKNAVEAFRKQWGKKMDDKVDAIHRKESTGYYDKNPDQYKKDWDEAYYARFIINLNDGEWANYLKEE